MAAVTVPLWGQTAIAPGGLPRPSPQHLRANLQTILSRPEYNQGESQWLEQFMYRLLHSISVWYREHLSRYFERLHDVSPVVYWTIVGVAALAMIALLYHIFLTVRSSFGTDVRRRRKSAPLPAEALQADPETLLTQADEAAARGDFAEGLRRLYLALIRNLDRHDLLRFDRSRTNYEYVRQARGQEAIAGPLLALTERAELVWYGDRAPERVDYEQCRQLAMMAWQGENAHAAP